MCGAEGKPVVGKLLKVLQVGRKEIAKSGDFLTKAYSIESRYLSPSGILVVNRKQGQFCDNRFIALACICFLGMQARPNAKRCTAKLTKVD
jgi:hypothetical protein